MPVAARSRHRGIGAFAAHGLDLQAVTLQLMAGQTNPVGQQVAAAPTDDRRLPDAVMSVIGSLAAFDHWRQQVTLLANSFVSMWQAT